MGVKCSDPLTEHLLVVFSGKVLVHCREGVSRSATLVVAYLMLKEGMTVQDAVRTVRESREICPNEGFLQQLCDFDKELQQKNSQTPHGVSQTPHGVVDH